MTQRVALGVEYDGTAFSGWQSQTDARTVQDCLERAVSTVADEAVSVTCAGRTDAGVHATGQVVHFDARAERPERSWVLGINSNLPPDANVLWARPVSADFHARYRALSRSYRYLLRTGVSRSSLNRHRASWIRASLDIQRMQQAAVRFIGEHDFSAFRSAACQAKTSTRRVDRLSVTAVDGFIAIDITANAFLHNMVRIVAGVLIRIGAGEAEIDWVTQLLDHGDRTRSGITAPPQGLCLAAVAYPDEFDLPVPDRRLVLL